MAGHVDARRREKRSGTRVRLIALIFLLEHFLGITESHFNCVITSDDGEPNAAALMLNCAGALPNSLIVDLSITSLRANSMRNENVFAALSAACVLVGHRRARSRY